MNKFEFNPYDDLRMYEQMHERYKKNVRGIQYWPYWDIHLPFWHLYNTPLAKRVSQIYEQAFKSRIALSKKLADFKWKNATDMEKLISLSATVETRLIKDLEGMEPLVPEYTISEYDDVIFDDTSESKVDLIFQVSGDQRGFVKMGFIKASAMPDYGNFLAGPIYRHVPLVNVIDDNLVMEFGHSQEFTHLIFERFYNYLYDFCTDRQLSWPQTWLENSSLHLRATEHNDCSEAYEKYRERQTKIYNGDPQNPLYQNQITELVRSGFPRNDSHRNDHVDFLINHFNQDETRILELMWTRGTASSWTDFSLGTLSAAFPLVEKKLTSNAGEQLLRVCSFNIGFGERYPSYNIDSCGNIASIKPTGQNYNLFKLEFVEGLNWFTLRDFFSRHISDRDFEINWKANESWHAAVHDGHTDNAVHPNPPNKLWHAMLCDYAAGPSVELDTFRQDRQTVRQTKEALNRNEEWWRSYLREVKTNPRYEKSWEQYWSERYQSRNGNNSDIMGSPSSIKIDETE